MSETAAKGWRKGVVKAAEKMFGLVLWVWTGFLSLALLLFLLSQSGPGHPGVFDGPADYEAGLAIFVLLIAVTCPLVFWPFYRLCRRQGWPAVRIFLAGSMLLFFVGTFLLGRGAMAAADRYARTPAGVRAAAEAQRDAAAQAERDRLLRDAAKDAAETRDRAEARDRLGRCLGWNGANRYLVDEVKPTLRNPRSFEHVETTVNPDGSPGMAMRFRAENGFGGMGLSIARAEIDPNTCRVKALTIETLD